MSKHSFKGLGVALVTPFSETNKVDYKSLERLVEHLLRDRATDFLVVHGTTGESPCLTRQAGRWSLPHHGGSRGE